MDYIDHFTLLMGASGRGTVDQCDSSIKDLVMNETASLGLNEALEGRKEFWSTRCLMYTSGSVLMFQVYILPQQYSVEWWQLQQNKLGLVLFPQQELVQLSGPSVQKTVKPFKTCFLLWRDKLVFWVFTDSICPNMTCIIKKKIPDWKETWGQSMPV